MTSKLLYIYSNQDRAELAKEEANGLSIKQSREPRNGPTEIVPGASRKEQRPDSGETAVFSTNGAGTGRPRALTQVNLDAALTPFTKTTEKGIADLNVKGKSINLPEDNTGENPDDLGSVGNFLDTTAKA